LIPIKTSVEDMRKLLGYMSKQIGWVEQSKVEKALGAIDDRKVSAMVALGLVQRDGSNLKLPQRGQAFASGDEAGALKDAVREMELYRATIEWMHYQGKSEVTATEIGQYWEASHSDTLGSLKGSTLSAGAVCFGRVAEGAGFGTFTIGRAGKETRLTTNLDAISKFVDGVEPDAMATNRLEPEQSADSVAANGSDSASAIQPTAVTPAAPPMPPSPIVSVSASPTVHVNVEIHIAADATADTVKEIFRNMARYVLDKPIDDDGV
jgi:hypothetical protein